MIRKDVPWEGELLSVQPYVKITRSYDERSDEHLAYVLRLRGTIGDEAREFHAVAAEGLQETDRLKVGDRAAGQGDQVGGVGAEPIDLDKLKRVVVLSRATEPAGDPPPFVGLAPALGVYRERGCRRLAARRYATRCSSCIWGCEASVEMIVDPWKPSVRRYRRETFC